MFQGYAADLSHLVWFSLVSIVLKVNLVFNTFFSKDVVTPTCAFVKSQVVKELA